MYTLIQFRNEGGFGWKLPDILFSAGYSLFRLLLVLEEIFSWNLSIGLFIGYKQSALRSFCLQYFNGSGH